MSKHPRLSFEALEDRQTPTLFVVNVASDDAEDAHGMADGQLSLREAIIAANTNAPFGDAPAGNIDIDIITFDATVFGPGRIQTIGLTQGELPITDDVIITGLNASGSKLDLTISAGGTSRIFAIDAAAAPGELNQVDLDNLTLADGNAGAGNDGGAVFIADGNDVGILQSVVKQSTAANGGGIYAGDGFLLLSETEVISNVATAGVANTGGGGLFVAGGWVEVSFVRFTLNESTDLGDGGAILSGPDSEVNVFASQIRENQAGRAGGGIEVNQSSVVLADVLLENNITGVNGGGLHTSASGIAELEGGQVMGNTAGQEGGGLWNAPAGTLTISGTTVVGNLALGTATNKQGGGGVFNEGDGAGNGGTVSISHATIANNIAVGEDPGEGGGGVFNLGDMVILDSMIAHNVVDSDLTTDGLQGLGNGGGILAAPESTLSITGGEVHLNQVPRAGGGIENYAGTVDLIGVTLRDNFAGINGGGFHTSGAGTVSFTGGTVEANIALNEGGGMWNSTGGEMRIADVLFVNNRADFGGALFNDGTSGMLTVGNSTLSGNEAHIEGGGLASEGGMVHLRNVTVAFNQSSGQGGGLSIDGGTLEAVSTLIANNTASTGPDIHGTLTSAGFNLVGNTAGGTLLSSPGNDLVDVDPRLQPLANNGGGTLTHALRLGSPAVDAGANLDGQAFDQRGPGFLRVVGASADIGAFEVRNGIFVVDGTLVIDNTSTGRSGFIEIRPGIANSIRVRSDLIHFQTQTFFGITSIDMTLGSDFDRVRMDASLSIPVRLVDAEGGAFVQLGDGNHDVLLGKGYANVRLGNGDHRLDVGAGGSFVRTEDGNSQILAADGFDNIRTGAGNDTIDIGAGGSFVQAGDGANVVRAAAGYDLIRTGDGNDTVEVGSGGSWVRGGAGDDVLLGGGDRDHLDGQDGNDILLGASGNDFLRGGRGDDVIVAGVGRDEVRGGLGDDRLFDGEVSAENQARLLALLAGLAADPDAVAGLTITTDGDRDQLFGDAGSDVFWVGGLDRIVADGTDEIRRR